MSRKDRSNRKKRIARQTALAACVATALGQTAGAQASRTAVDNGTKSATDAELDLSPFWERYFAAFTGWPDQASALLPGTMANLDLVDGIATQKRADPSYAPLRDSSDQVLQHALDAMMEPPALARAVREKRLAAALVDITDAENPRTAMVNGDVMMYAASLPKIAILFGVFEQAHANGKSLDATTLQQVTRMIRNSSNSAATEMFYRVGPARLAELLQSPRYRFYDPDTNGGLWVGKPYARKDTWQRDPLHNLSHGATAFQVARFFYLLETGRLVSAESSADMKRILGYPAINHKFVKGLSGRPGTKIFRKSGTWRTYHSDAGIIERDGKRYIAVVLANDIYGSSWLSELIVHFDDAIAGQSSG